jgi:pimeloyl-ACP methyl ester carboxylesterase
LLSACGGDSLGGSDGGGSSLDGGGSPSDSGGPLVDGGGAPGDASVPPGTDAGPMGTDSGVRPADPTAMGPFAVSTSVSTTLTRASRSIPVAAHVPAGTERVPLVILLPGFQVDSSAYSLLANRVASHGFLVVRADPDEGAGIIPMPSHVEMAADVVAAIDWAIADATLAPRVDSTRIAVVGHSLGGKLAFMVAATDARVRAVYAMDPINGGSPSFTGGTMYSTDRPDIVPEVVAPLTIPVGLPGETFSASGGIMPCAPADQNFLTFYDALTSSSWVARWTLEGADHMDFVDDRMGCGMACSAFICANGPGDAPTIRDANITLATAFMRRHLGGEAAMEAYLTGGSVPAVARDLAHRP